MLADVPNLFLVVGIPVLGVFLVLAVCLAVYKLLGGVLHE